MQRSLQRTAPQCLGQIRAGTLEHVTIPGGHVVLEELVEPLRRGRREHARQAVVGRDRADAEPGPIVPVIAIDLEAGPVSEDVGRR